MMRVISLTTDFGTGDFEIGTLSGVIWKIAPQAKIVDLTHDIAPQNVLQAALVLGEHTPYFPEGSIHVVVVDPGVGTQRRAVAGHFGGQWFVGPDNGVITRMYERARTLGQPVELVCLDQPRYWLTDVSRIFHGRDVFAPVAAHLAAGVPLSALGSPIDDPVLLDIPVPAPYGAGLRGNVIYIDHFGNLQTNITPRHLAGLHPETAHIQIGSTVINGMVKTFGQGQPGELVALVDSSNTLTISVVNGSAQKRLNARQGDPVDVFPQD